MTPEQVDRAMGFIREHMPQLHERLSAFRESDPVGFERLMNRMGPRIREAASVKDRDPKLFELRANEIRAGIQVLESARAYHDLKREKAPDDKLAAAQATLRDALAAQQDARAAMMAREIDALSERVKSLQADLERNKANRDNAIDALLDQITKGKEPRDLPFPPRNRRGEGPKDKPDAPPQDR